MKRILVCDNDIAQRKHLRAAIERFARDRQITNVVVAKALSPQAMLAELMRTRKSLFNMVICNAQGEGALDALKQLRRLDPNLRIALVSNQKADAVAAYEIGASLLLMPSNGQEFLKAVGEPLCDIAAQRSATIALKTASGVANIPLDDMLFAESAKRGPIIHLPNDENVSVRGSLQALHERLAQADAERFVKVGSSFVVNLDNVRSLGKGTLIFCNGETIIAPVRTRASLKEALSSYLYGNSS